MTTNPQFYGLSSRVVLEEDAVAGLSICVRRKSRFLLKDAQAFWEKAKKVQEKTNSLPNLKISAPLCSKAKSWLNEQGVVIFQENKRA